MKTLESQELAEANAYLAAFDNAYSRAFTYFGLAVFGAVAFPLISALSWWLGWNRDVIELVVATVVMPFVLAGNWFWWRMRATRAFRDIKWCALKLERAGFPLGWTTYQSFFFRGFVLVGEGESPIDFESITQEQLYTAHHAL